MSNSYVGIASTYILSEGVWLPKDQAEEFGYSDGDEAEQRVAAAIAGCDDVSLFSRSLFEHQIDWPSRYHLSASRANLLRPLADLLRGRVLEVGSGCGAISRYLGELGTTLVALEGSQRRARMTASRCRDLPNVQVVNDVLENFSAEDAFDAVTLIGVLEYARIYGKAADPTAAWLRKAHSLLADDGVLVVAIENQLGLKYLAGMPEDHVGKAMYGVSDNYGEKTVVTFGRLELTRMLQDAGFEHAEFLLPFPDYKFPSAVVFPAGYDGSYPQFDSSSLASQSASSDPQLPYAPLFALERAWTVIGRNGLLADMSNSFLVVARKRAVSVANSGPVPLALHFASERVPVFCKQVQFQSNTSSGEIEVVRSRLAEDDSVERSRPISMRLLPEPFLSGRMHSQALETIVTRDGWTAAEVAEWLGQWKDALLHEVEVAGDYAEAGMLPGWALDALPRNLVQLEDGSYQFIDLEWVWHGELELPYLIYRAVIGSFMSLVAVGAPEDISHLHLPALLRQLMDMMNAPVGEGDVERFIDLDGMVTRLVYGRDSGLGLKNFSNLNLRSLPDVGRMSRDWNALMSDTAQRISDISRHFQEGIKEGQDDGEALRHRQAQLLAELAINAEKEQLSDGEIRQHKAATEDAERRREMEVEALRETLTEKLRLKEVQIQALLAASAARERLKDAEIQALAGSDQVKNAEIQSLIEASSERDRALERNNTILERMFQLAEQARETEVRLGRDLIETKDALGIYEQSLRLASERAAELDRLLASTSWRITMPLRVLRNMLRPQFVKQSVGRSLRSVYRALPVSEATRQSIKSASFRLMPGVFGKTNAYKNWLAARQPDQPQEILLSPQSASVEDGGDSFFRRYTQAILQLPRPSESEHVGIAAEIDPRANAARVIAFYLPQFHPFPENDAWWGRGFTEWTNVSKAVPQFVGHYQPHLPGELGFYDLRLIDVMRRQAELAKLYGIEGFCFHYYWFAGKRLMERPLDQLLASDVDLPFCICWANENWTRRWDGLDNEVLIAQDYSPEDDRAFIAELEPLLRDPRYIRVDGRPLVILYRPSLLPDAGATLERWRQHCREAGIGELFICMVQFDKLDPREYGFDAAVEFPPHKVAAGLPSINHELEIVNPGFQGAVVDYADVVSSAFAETKPEYELIRGVFPGWDNDARKPGKGYTVARSTPERYRTWLRGAIDYARQNPVRGESLVFVNAWNEWAEGAHLEPDRRYGYAYLEATRQALRRVPTPRTPERVVVIIHAFYPELLPEMLASLSKWTIPYRLVISTVSRNVQEVKVRLADAGMEADVQVYENHGRDILPFLETLKTLDVSESLVLKLHTKRSLHREDGESWRRDMLDKLLDPYLAARNFDAFRQQPELGLSAPEGHILPMTTYWGANADAVYRLSRQMHSDPVDPAIAMFAAGSMFYARVEAIQSIIDLELTREDFEPEAGQVDGTLAHAIERCFSIATCSSGYYIASSNTPFTETYGSFKTYAYAKPTLHKS
ncbi:glycoside hydrolase family 99-like domain-containing protein [Xanthomonas bromi]|nr:glycoside hydrolase family 99-like domain-containing protein [Xanthomonas bromi]